MLMYGILLVLIKHHPRLDKLDQQVDKRQEGDSPPVWPHLSLLLGMGGDDPEATIVLITYIHSSTIVAGVGFVGRSLQTFLLFCVWTDLIKGDTRKWCNCCCD